MKHLAHSGLMRGFLAFMLVMAFCTVLAALFLTQVPPDNRETLTYALGQLSGMVTTALAFYFATSQGSVDKQHLLAKDNGDKE